jgi:hypothetical protein
MKSFSLTSQKILPSILRATKFGFAGKIIHFGQDARKSLLDGCNKLTNAV